MGIEQSHLILRKGSNTVSVCPATRIPPARHRKHIGYHLGRDPRGASIAKARNGAALISVYTSRTPL